MLFMLMHLAEGKNKLKLLDLYIRYRDIMYRHAMSIVKDPSLSEDAVHDAFEKVINYLNKNDGMIRGSTVGFLAAVTRNSAIDLLRKRKNIVYVDDYTDCDFTGDLTPLSELVSSEGYNELTRQINSLSEHYRIALILRFMNGLEPSEAAKIMGITPDLVNTYVSRGRKALMRKREDQDGK